MNIDKRRHIIITIGLLIAVTTIIAILGQGLTVDQTKVPSALIGKTAFPFKVQWVQGRQFLPAVKAEQFSLADFKGKPLILNFWASWCHSCREEARDLQALWKKYQDRGLFVVGIAIQDTTDAAKQFAGFYGKTYILGLDVDGSAAIDYGVSGVPETFVIDKNSTIVYKEVGAISPPVMDQYIQKIL